MVNEQEQLLGMGLSYLAILGLNPFSKINYLYATLGTISLLIIIVLVFVKIYLEPMTFKLFSDSFESLFTGIHAGTKLLTLAFNTDKIKILYETMANFWQYQTFEDADVVRKLDNIVHIAKIVLKVYSLFTATSAVLFSIRPLFADALAITCYIPVEYIPREVFICFNNMVFAICAFSVCTFDVFSCALLIILYVQLKLFNAKIALMKFEGIRTNEDKDSFKMKIKEYIDYHNDLYGFLKTINSTISLMLLIHLAIAPVTLCFELYFLTVGGSWVELAKSLMYLIGISAELFLFYCLPSTLLTLESEKSMNVIYSCDWYECDDISIRKYFIIIMQRLQTEAVINAGSIYPVNLETCTNAYSLALSFYSSLKVLEKA